MTLLVFYKHRVAKTATGGKGSKNPNYRLQLAPYAQDHTTHIPRRKLDVWASKTHTTVTGIKRLKVSRPRRIVTQCGIATGRLRPRNAQSYTTRRVWIKAVSTFAGAFLRGTACTTSSHVYSRTTSQVSASVRIAPLTHKIDTWTITDEELLFLLAA